MPALGRLAKVGVLVRQLSSLEAEAMENRSSPKNAELHARRPSQATLEAETRPRVERMRFAAHRRPSGCLGGDFHCVVPADGDRFTIAIGSIGGERFPTALVRAMLLDVVRAHGHDQSAPGSVMHRLALLLDDLNEGRREHWITCSIVCAVVDRAHNALVYCNAGHPAPLVRLRGQRWSTLSLTGATLGGAPRNNTGVGMQVVELDAVERVLFYTDGLMQGLACPDQPSAEERMQRLFDASALLPVDVQLEAVLRTLREAPEAGGRPRRDLTILLADFAASREWGRDGRQVARGAASARVLDGFRPTAPAGGAVTHVPA
jgi:serine phosphatase RsbU (regulator of sigma subunit)